MKKFLAIFVAVAAVIFYTASVSSCSKESDSKASDSLAGTTWTASDGGSYITLVFLSDTNFSITIAYGGETYPSNGTYTRNGNTLMLTCTDGYLYTGIINGNVLYLTDVDDGVTDKLTKNLF